MIRLNIWALWNMVKLTMSWATAEAAFGATVMLDTQFLNNKPPFCAAIWKSFKQLNIVLGIGKIYISLFMLTPFMYSKLFWKRKCMAFFNLLIY